MRTSVRTFEDHIGELRAFVGSLERMPNKKADDKEERSLETWLMRQPRCPTCICLPTYISGWRRCAAFMHSRDEAEQVAQGAGSL